MNILISGYGRMGKEVEKTAASRGHRIVAAFDRPDDWEGLNRLDPRPDVVIDFSQPEVVTDNLKRCFAAGLPVVTGTTGWYDRLTEISALCMQHNGALFYAPNFSIGMNIFFRVNKTLARLMGQVEGYRLSLEEIHHIHKLDSPSGTAIRIAEDILAVQPSLKRWVNQASEEEGVIPILSKREGEVPGTHSVVYDSAADRLTFRHEAKNRSGFALGAVLAAEFLSGKSGVFTMDDLLSDTE